MTSCVETSLFVTIGVWDHCSDHTVWDHRWDHRLGPSFVTFGTMGRKFWDHVWDHNLGPCVFGTWFGTMHVWDQLWDHGCLFCLGPPFHNLDHRLGTMLVWDHGLGPSFVWDLGVWDAFGMGELFWDHGCSGPWVFGTSCLGVFGIWDHGCLGPSTKRVWDQLRGTSCLGPWVFGDHCLGLYRLGPSFGTMFDHACLGPVSFGTTIWDHGCLGPTIWDHACLGPWFGTIVGCLRPPFGTEDHGCLGPAVSCLGSFLDHGQFRFGSMVVGPFRTMGVWDPRVFGTMCLACVFGDQLFGPDHGCLGLWVFGIMVVWDALSGLWAAEVLGGCGRFWGVLVGSPL